MKIALIFNKHRADAIGVYFQRACSALGITADHWWLHQTSAMPTGYDLYLRVDHGDDYDAAWPAHAHPAAFYVVDTHLAHNWSKIRRGVRRYDLIFCAHRDATRMLRGATWLPVACEPPARGEPPEGGPWDVVSVGMDGGVPRKFLMQALRERYRRSVIGMAPHTQLMAMYGQAKIGFNFSIRGEINMRVFEVMGGGALLLTNPLPEDDLERLGLRDGVSLIVYRSPGELAPLIDRWLADEPGRRRIAQEGCRIVRERHTYVRRLEVLVETARTRLGRAGARQMAEGRACGSS
jgi:hypothetical protein